MTQDEDPRLVVIEPAEHVLGDRGRCSCCHHAAPRGVRVYTRRDVAFDPMKHAHVFICETCAARLGAAVAGAPS